MIVFRYGLFFGVVYVLYVGLHVYVKEGRYAISTVVRVS